MLFFKQIAEIGGTLHMGKGEVITWPSLTGYISRAKSSFIWLGFCFQLSQQEGLIFSSSKIKQKQAKILNYAHFIGKLNLCSNVKLRIYNTYIRPIVEIFAICWNMHKDVKSFQNKTLTAILGIPRSVGLEREYLRNVTCHRWKRRGTRLQPRQYHGTVMTCPQFAPKNIWLQNRAHTFIQRKHNLAYGIFSHRHS